MHCVCLYHYCLSCSQKSYSIVMRRHHILDCYTVPYNASLLKAFKNKVEVKPLFSMLDYWKMEEKYEENIENLENTNLSHLISNHRIVPLSEMFALADNKKIRSISSQPIEFVAAFEEQKPKFKKIAVSNETSFELPGKGFYQELSSNILRHFGRLNGRDLLLIETALWYDVLLQRESIELLQIYKDNLDKIPAGDIMGINGQKLPSYIICQNTQILKLRRKMKILQVPDVCPLSKDLKYMHILLYYPLKPGQRIDTERIGK